MSKKERICCLVDCENTAKHCYHHKPMNNTEPVEGRIAGILAHPTYTNEKRIYLLSELFNFELALRDKQLRENIGMLRQWINEDHITDPKKMITNEHIEYWLGLFEGGIQNESPLSDWHPHDVTNECIKEVEGMQVLAPDYKHGG